MGQASTQRPQRMQGPSSKATACASLKTTMPLVALVMEMLSFGAHSPVMGPPAKSLAASSFTPPHAASASA